MKKITISVASISMCLVLLVPVLVYAQATNPVINSNDPAHEGPATAPVINSNTPAGTSNSSSYTPLQNPLKVNSIGGLIQNFVVIFSYLVILLAVLAFIWTGLQYILARGNTEKMKEATKRLGYIVIGVAVVLGARLLITVVINTLQATGTVNPQIIESAQNANSGQ